LATAALWSRAETFPQVASMKSADEAESMMTGRRAFLSVLGALLIFSPAHANAQVALSQSSFEAGVNFAAFFKVERGCGTAPTTALRVQIPEGVSVVQLPEKLGWTMNTEWAGPRVTAVTWQGRLESAQPDQFGLLVKLPAKPGPLYFAAVQRCGAQEIRWTDVPPASTAHPAPKLTLVAAPAADHANHSSPIMVMQPWARATPPGAPTAAAYLTIMNRGTEPDVLVGGSSPQADRVEFHLTTNDNGVMKMRPATSGITVPAGGMVELKPDGGYHVMLAGLKAPLRSGTMLPVTLRFAKAGSIEVVFAVEPIGARGPSAGAATEHNHH
jgi:periplasmic copper chaperone A